MSDSMENGPSNYNGETEHVWERPWTLEEMRKSSSNWSLAADSGLFLYLQDFSQRMLSKTHEIEKQLDGLIRDTKATDSCLHTVFNDFLMLSNTQFIENRVYDEEVEEATPKTETQEKRPEQEKTREQKEAELIPKVQEAVNYGLKVLESAFEQLDIKAGNSDSEDEEATDRVEPILEPKDLYVDRPLPYLIGSQAFMEQDDVGLGDLSSDEMSIDSDRESVIESEEGKDGEQQSDEDFDQEDEGQGSLKKKPSVVSYDEEEEEDDEDSDIFGESDKDEDDIPKGDVGPTSFADELAARIKGDTTSKPEADRTSLSSGPSVSKKKNKGKKLPKAPVDDDNDEMFGPPKMEDDEYSPFGGKGGLFSGGKGLFDDDDEGDLFSETHKNVLTEKEQRVPQTTESVKAKKIPTGAVSIFPENSLFGSQNAADSVENKENGTPVKPKVQAAPKQSAVGGGLFDDNDDDDDDFFSGKMLRKPTSGGQEKPKPKKKVDLFGADEDDEDDEGDIFSAATSQQSKKIVKEEEKVQPPEKKLPAGAISMFGPGTKNLLVEGLKKRQPSTSEESEKSEESVPPPEVKPSPVPKVAEKVQSKSLFSDDEDSQIFSTVPKSQSKPEVPSQGKPNKAPLSIFDDDDEEDLFSSVPKPKSIQVKAAALQPKKTVSSALFSDDEDQWMGTKPSTVKPEAKSGGMKPSNSAPPRLPSAKAPQKDGLFNDKDDNDLFAVTKETSQKKPQRVSLLFEDEDEDKESLFGFKPPENKTATEVKVPAASQPSSLFVPEEKEEVAAVPVETKVAEERPSEKKPVQTTPSPEESSISKKKPAGAVSLFGGISVLGDGAETIKRQTKSVLDDFDDCDWHKETPPPMENKEKKGKKTTLSLFDDDDIDEDEDEPDETSPVSRATEPADSSTLKPQEQKSHGKSTGVFQDEELLFSQTQQRDNDPDVDLFATTAKPSAPLPSSAKSSVPTLFGDEDDDDDLFSSAKPKARPKVPEKPSKPKKDETDKGSSTAQSALNEKPASPVKPKETSRIGKLQANLAINPASLLPGAGPRMPGAVSVIPNLAHFPSARAGGSLASSTGPLEHQPRSEGGVSFDAPVQVTTLQNANKDRTKGATRRRPQTRAARHMAAQRSEEARGNVQEENTTPRAAPGGGMTSPFNPVSVRPSALTLPVTTTSIATAHRRADESVRPKVPPPAAAATAAAKEDLFASDDLFASVSVPKHIPSPQPKTKASETVPDGTTKKDAGLASKKDPTLSIFDDHEEDLFATVKPKPVKKSKVVPFLDDDDDDIFRAEKRQDSKVLSDSTKSDIFQDEKETPSKALKKPKEASVDASLFDDDVDIFADLTPTTKPKGKKVKKKIETKSIFDDDMDDIFSSGITKAAVTPSSKSKKPPQEPSSAEESGHDIFDDPLNVLGGN